MFLFLNSTGYPAVYFPSPFLGFYPPMGMASMPYPSYYPQQFMPGYFPSPGYPAYMPQPNTPYPTANGPSYGPSGSHLTHGQGPSKNRERGATQVNRRSEETKPRDSSSTGITESKSTEEGVDGRWLNQKDGDKKQDSTAGGQGGETNGTWDNVAETSAISEVTVNMLLTLPWSDSRMFIVPSLSRQFFPSLNHHALFRLLLSLILLFPFVYFSMYVKWCLLLLR